MKKTNNLDQAKQIVDAWPEWKRNYQLTNGASSRAETVRSGCPPKGATTKGSDKDELGR